MYRTQLLYTTSSNYFQFSVQDSNLRRGRHEPTALSARLRPAQHHYRASPPARADTHRFFDCLPGVLSVEPGRCLIDFVLPFMVMGMCAPDQAWVLLLTHVSLTAHASVCGCHLAFLKTLDLGQDTAPGDCKHVRQSHEHARLPGQPFSHGHELFRQAELVHEGETLGRRRNHAVRRRAHGATARALELLCGKHDQHGAATRFEVHPRARGSGACLQQ